MKQAYRRLAMELHPDRNPENPRIAEKFKDVSAAYAIVGDPDKRARFDRGDIDAWGRRRPRRPTPQASATAESSDTRSNRTSTGNPAEGPAPNGTKQQQTTGSKAAPNAQPKTASADPNAKTAPPPGREKKPRATGKPGWLAGGIKAEDIFGPLFPSKTARAQPNAAPPVDPTHRLRVSFVEAATGTAKRLTTGRGRALEVAVPPGIRDGQIVRLKGQGETGPLGRRGDALVKIDVTPHKLF
ncbi:MAG: DnaJ domain-containing protein, partial [Alphaproteobacteria bacterium]